MSLRALICDLDGVVFRGDEPCPGAAEALQDARDHGIAVLFLTNNAARPPRDVVEHLARVGAAASVDEVLTSSQVAAQLVVDRGLAAAGTAVLAVGGPGVSLALAERGLSVVEPADVVGSEFKVSCVVQGYGPQVAVADLAEACFAISGGARWVVTNTDATLPSPRGFGPGNGSLVAAVATATDRQPDLVCGKPEATAYLVALERLGVDAQEALAIGDRLDTDIDGAHRAGIPDVLVLTGVHGRTDVEAAAPEDRPGRIVERLTDLAPLWR